MRDWTGVYPRIVDRQLGRPPIGAHDQRSLGGSGVVCPQPDDEGMGTSLALVHREGESDRGGFPRLEGRLTDNRAGRSTALDDIHDTSFDELTSFS